MEIFYPIELLADYITNDLLNLSWHLNEALNFFIYDSIKIFLLMIVIIHIMTLINNFLPIEKIRGFLSKKKFYWFDYFFASTFWAITPFCSCSSIPLFVGFLKAWIPMWITFAFLITSPLVNEVAIAMFIWVFGIKITAIYIITWITLWMLWGFIVWKLWLDNEIADFVLKARNTWIQKIEKQKIIWKIFIKKVIKDSFDLIWKIMPYVLVWVAIWWLIHWFVPTWFFEKYMNLNNPFAVPVAVIAWIPMYSNAAWVVPIIWSLIDKWIPIWTALAFMMAVVWLSLPEFLILKKVMKTKLLLSFFAIVWFFMILSGYLFNLIL